MVKTPGRPVGEYDLKRKEIAEATWRVLADRGLDGASMRAIAREAGYTTGALVHYFENKDELLEYVVTQAAKGVKDHLKAALEDEDVQNSLREIALNNLPLSEADRKRIIGWQSFLVAADKNPQVAATISSVRATLHKQLTKLIEKGQSYDLIRDDIAARDLADQIDAFVDGLARMTPFEPKRLTRKRLVHLVDVQIEMLKK